MKKHIWKKVLLMQAALITSLVMAVSMGAAASLRGDLNSDGKVNTDDAIYLLYHTFSPDEYPTEQSADLNGDGKVNTDDAIYLLYYTFSPEEYPLAESVLPSDGLSFTLNDDGESYSVSGIGSCTDEKIIIPSVCNSKPVTAISAMAFENCTNVTEIKIPDSVTSIGSMAFYGCTGLKSINIPKGVVSIQPGVFTLCENLESITVSKDNTVYHSSGNCLIDTAKKELTAGCKNSLIPTDGSVEIIGAGSFIGCTGLTGIAIPESVTIINSAAFIYCSGITEITIPENVVYIGTGVFIGCVSLEKITVSPGNLRYQSTGNCLTDTASRLVIAGCKNSVIPSDGSVTGIGDGAFYGCAGLSSTVIPDGVTSIGSEAFCGCFALESITIPASVTKISDCAFEDCTELTSIIFTGTKSQWKAIEKGEGWNNSTGEYTIHCTDGKIAK